jgi:uncharacterized membrane protein
MRIDVAMLLSVHVAAGALALVVGAVALGGRKGGLTHRRAGLLFVGAMLAMGITGSMLGLRRSAADANATGGVMTAYFVVTALTSVRRPSPALHVVNGLALTAAATLAAVDAALAVEAFSHPTRTLNGVPFAMLSFLAMILALSAAGDVRVLRGGPLRGRQRLVRHLWRMCFALFIAAGSFFSIRERVATVLPEPLTTLPLRVVPILLPFAAMAYFTWRLRRGSVGLPAGAPR